MSRQQDVQPEDVEFYEFFAREDGKVIVEDSCGSRVEVGMFVNDRLRITAEELMELDHVRKLVDAEVDCETDFVRNAERK